MTRKLFIPLLVAVVCIQTITMCAMFSILYRQPVVAASPAFPAVIPVEIVASKLTSPIPVAEQNTLKTKVTGTVAINGTVSINDDDLPLKVDIDQCDSNWFSSNPLPVVITRR